MSFSGSGMTPDEIHAAFQQMGFVEYLGSCGTCGVLRYATVNPKERPWPECLECATGHMSWVYVPPPPPESPR